MNRLQRQNHRRFRKAQATARAQGGQVAATYDPDGQPVYFVMPPDAPDRAVRNQALAIRGIHTPSAPLHMFLDLLDHPGDVDLAPSLTAMSVAASG